MNEKEFEEKQILMSDKDLIKEVEKQISGLARSGGKSHTMTVPPRINDTDMILSELLRRFKTHAK